MASFSKQFKIFYKNSISIFTLIGEKLSLYVFSPSHKVEPASVILINCHAVKWQSKHLCLNAWTLAALSHGQRTFILQWATVNGEINWTKCRE